MRILTRNPAALAAQRQGEAAAARESLEEAALGFRTAARLEPRSALAWLDLGNVEAQLAHRPAALEALTKAADLQPTWGDVWRAIATTAADDHQLTRAAQAARRATQLEPRSAASWLVLAHVQLLSGDIPAAEASSRKAVALRPDLPDAWLSQGDVLMAAPGGGQARDAMAAFQHAVSLRPDAYGWRRLGEAQRQVGDLREASRSLREAIRLAPRDVAARSALLQVLQTAGQAAEAAQIEASVRTLQEARYRLIALERKEQQSPADPVLKRRLALELLAQGDTAAATRYLKLALQLNPDDEEARRRLAQIEEGGAPVSGSATP